MKEKHSRGDAKSQRSRGVCLSVKGARIARGLEANSCGCGDGDGDSGARRVRTSEMCAQTPLLEVAPHVRRLCIRSAVPLSRRRRVWRIRSSSCCRRVCVRSGLRAASAGGPGVAAPEALDGDAQQIIPPEAVEVRAVVREERVRVARRRRRRRALAASGDGERASDRRRALRWGLQRLRAAFFGRESARLMAGCHRGIRSRRAERVSEKASGCRSEGGGGDGGAGARRVRLAEPVEDRLSARLALVRGSGWSFAQVGM